MDRRTFLGITGATIAVTGCVSNGGTTGQDDAPAPPTLIDHDFANPSTSNYELLATIRNDTDNQLRIASADIEIFDDNTRVVSNSPYVRDLPPDIEEQDSRIVDQFEPDIVTHYTITMEGETEDFEQTDTTEHEFDGDEFREKLD